MRAFSKRMGVVADTVDRNSDTLTRRVAIKVDQVVVMGTPVDTGRARSNWITSLGSARRDTLSPYAPGEGGSTGSANAQAAMDQCEAVVAHYQHGNEIHIANSLPYIGKLNEGSSAQAPANFVEESVNVAVQSIKGARLLVTRSTDAD